MLTFSSEITARWQATITARRSETGSEPSSSLSFSLNFVSLRHAGTMLMRMSADSIGGFGLDKLGRMLLMNASAAMP